MPNSFPIRFFGFLGNPKLRYHCRPTELRHHDRILRHDALDLQPGKLRLGSCPGRWSVGGLANLGRHEPDPKSDRTRCRAAHELPGLHSHTGSISWARTRETRRAQNAGTCGEHTQPGRCGSGGTKSTFLGVSDPGPRGHFVDLGEI